MSHIIWMASNTNAKKRQTYDIVVSQTNIQSTDKSEIIPKTNNILKDWVNWRKRPTIVEWNQKLQQILRLSKPKKKTDTSEKNRKQKTNIKT